MLISSEIFKAIKDGALHPWLDEEEELQHLPVHPRIISAVECLKDDIEDDDLVPHAIMGIITLFKHGSQSKVSLYSQNSFGRTGMQGAPKRVKNEALVKYERFFEIADASNPGQCFVMMTQNGTQSKEFLKYLVDWPVVGTLVLVGSPKKSTRIMSKSLLPIIQTDYPLLPLTRDNPQCDLLKLYPSVPIRKPQLAGEVVYFSLHAVGIGLSRYNYDLTTASCTGRTCDRALKREDPNISCGCMNQGIDVRSSVLDVTIQIPVSNTVDARGKVDVAGFRSFRFTQLMTKSCFEMQMVDAVSMGKKTNTHRFVAKEIVEHVNDNGGWSVVGWFRKGEQQDASSEHQRVESLQTRLHVSLLTPTKQAYRLKTDNDFNAMLIDMESKPKKRNQEPAPQKKPSNRVDLTEDGEHMSTKPSAVERDQMPQVGTTTVGVARASRELAATLRAAAVNGSVIERGTAALMNALSNGRKQQEDPAGSSN